ncbi:MAG: hypothetical protein ACRDCL_02410, partial [Aeromonas veronii]
LFSIISPHLAAAIISRCRATDPLKVPSPAKPLANPALNVDFLCASRQILYKPIASKRLPAIIDKRL